MQNPLALALAALGLLATVGFTTAIDTYRLSAHAQTYGMTQTRSCNTGSGHSHAACRPAKPA
jgi:hypothetical protein